MVAFDGAGFDWSFMADEEVPTNLALMAFSDSEYNSLRVEFNKSEFDLATYKRGLAYVEEQLVFYKKNEVMPYDQIVVLKRDASFRDSKINALNIQIEKLKKEKESNQIKIDKFENTSKSLDKLIGSQIYYNNRKGVGYIVVPLLPTGLFAPPTIDLSSSGLKEFQQPEFKGYGVNVNKVLDESEEMVSDNVQHKSEPKPEQTKQPRKESSSRAAAPLSAARPINTVAPKLFMNVAKTKPNVSQKAHSLSRKPFNQQTTLNNRSLNNKVNTAKVNSINTAKGKRVTSVVGEQEVTTADTALNTASVPISTASATLEVSTAAANLVYIKRSAEKRKDKGKAIMIEDEYVQKNSKKQLEQERLSHEEAIRLQEHIDEEERKRIARDAEIAKQLQEEYNTAHVIDWNDPYVIRYHALQHRLRSVAKVRKNMIMYLKNQGGYKMKDFKGMIYDDIRSIFEKVWDQIHSFVLMDSEEEV
ncbi:hypothetical protein Tco_1281863 [Tanacetum coccineum]